MSLHRTMMLNPLAKGSHRIALTKRATVCPALRNAVFNNQQNQTQTQQYSSSASRSSSIITMATTHAGHPTHALGQNPHQAPRVAVAKPQKRTFTNDSRIGKVYSFADIKAIAGQDKGVVIVDSREPRELTELGRIPGAINIPIDSAPDAYSISEEDFHERYGYDRPAKDAHIVTYCRAGVRCHTAAALAKAAGFTDVNEYPGSWKDWEANAGDVEKV